MPRRYLTRFRVRRSSQPYVAPVARQQPTSGRYLFAAGLAVAAYLPLAVMWVLS